jgi:hypothetical protein
MLNITVPVAQEARGTRVDVKAVVAACPPRPWLGDRSRLTDAVGRFRFEGDSGREGTASRALKIDVRDPHDAQFVATGV